MVLKKIKKGLVFFRYLGKHKQQYWPWTVGHRQQILVGRYIFLSQSILRKPKKVSNIWSEEGLEPSKYFWNKYDIHFNDNQMLRPNARVLSMEVKVTWICGLVSLHLVTGRGLLPQDAQGFSAWWAKVILHMWTCWRHVSLKTVVFDWWSHVPLIIHALCLCSSGARSHLQGSHPAVFSTRSAWHFCSNRVTYSDCCASWNSRGFNPFSVYWILWAVPFLLQYMVPLIQQCGHISEFHVRYSNHQQNQACCVKKQKQKNYAKNALQLKWKARFSGYD